jgi:hypothetical protein
LIKSADDSISQTGLAGHQFRVAAFRLRGAPAEAHGGLVVLGNHGLHAEDSLVAAIEGRQSAEDAQTGGIRRCLDTVGQLARLGIVKGPQRSRPRSLS